MVRYLGQSKEAVGENVHRAAELLSGTFKRVSERAPASLESIAPLSWGDTHRELKSRERSRVDVLTSIQELLSGDAEEAKSLEGRERDRVRLSLPL